MKIFITSLLFLATTACYSQTIEKFSIASGGAVTENGGISLVYSIGETIINETVSGNINLSGGFINGPFNVTVAINEDAPVSGSGILIYPNPVSTCMYIKTSLRIEDLELYDTLGQKVLHQKHNAGCLDVSTLKPGLYVLKIMARDLELTEKIMINN